LELCFPAGGGLVRKYHDADAVAIAGSVLVWLPLLVPVLLSAAELITERVFRFNYLIPAELFPALLAGAIMLLTAALLARSRRAEDRIGPASWQWALVASSFAGYSLVLVALGVGGMLLLRGLFRKGPPLG
jgi:hypothetical protein